MYGALKVVSVQSSTAKSLLFSLFLAYTGSMLAGDPLQSTRSLLVFLLAAVLAFLIPFGELSAAPNDRLSLTVYKSRREMYLYRGNEIVKIYRVFLGSSPVGHKLERGDNRTPEGHYRVVDKKISENFHRFIGIDYPNAHDAELAFRQGRITSTQKSRIKHAVLEGVRPPANTLLGGHLGIHGIGTDEKFKLELIGDMDWTNGCIAVTNTDIRELYERIPIGTAVRIHK